MRRFCRLIPGSVRALACTLRRSRRNASGAANTQSEAHVLKSSRWRGRHRQHARAHALPGMSHPRFLVACAVVPVAVALAFVWWLPMPNELQKSPSGTLTLLDCRGREIAELASSEARTQFPVALEHMGPWLPRLTVALEDRRFYEHRGVDWRATMAACARNLRSRQIVSGASTITQQLVKLASSRDRRCWSNKLYEAIIAWKLERCWSKQRILSEYLDRSSYGNRRRGIL